MQKKVLAFFTLFAIASVFATLADAQMPNSDKRSPSANSRLAPQHVQKPVREPIVRAPVRSRNFGGHVYHGRLAWERGRWHHETHNGRYGWWWDVGGVWYFYSEPIEGPPDYVSDISVAEEATAEPAPPPQASNHAFYYRPGDIKGVPYDRIEACWQTRQRAGNVGVCVLR